jgi:hypothetical protein
VLCFIQEHETAGINRNRPENIFIRHEIVPTSAMNHGMDQVGIEGPPRYFSDELNGSSAPCILNCGLKHIRGHWVDHFKAHLIERTDPPRMIQCWFCDSTLEGLENFLMHMFNELTRNKCQLKKAKPSRTFVEFLYNAGHFTLNQYQEFLTNLRDQEWDDGYHYKETEATQINNRWDPPERVSGGRHRRRGQ